MQQCKSNPINGGGGGGSPNQAMFAACSKCEIEFPINELDAHEQGCTFIPCSACFAAFDGSSGKVLCSDCVFANCIHHNADLVFDLVKQNTNQQWYETEWNTKERREEVEEYLKASGNPEQFYSVFNFCWSNQVKNFLLSTILHILNNFPEHQQERMQKHILTLPHNQLQLLENLVSLMVYFLYLSA